MVILGPAETRGRETEMELLVTQSIPTTRKVRAEYSEAIGRLVTPRHYPSLAETVAEGITLAADNDGFGGVDFEAFERMIAALEPYAEAVRFVTVPDVVCDARGTFELWAEWAPKVRELGLRPALVLQNGMVVSGTGVRFEHDVIAWAEIGAVFVGGDDAYKQGVEVAGIILEARKRGIWIHVGRVNTVRRLRHAMALRADSVDGSGWARFRDSMLPRYARWIAKGCPAELELSDPYPATGWQIMEGEAA
jgi:hypothetical protein